MHTGKRSERREEAAVFVVFAKFSPSERDLWANKFISWEPSMEIFLLSKFCSIPPLVKFAFQPPGVPQFQQRHRALIVVTALLRGPCKAPEEY